MKSTKSSFPGCTKQKIPPSHRTETIQMKYISRYFRRLHRPQNHISDLPPQMKVGTSQNVCLEGTDDSKRDIWNLKNPAIFKLHHFTWAARVSFSCYLPSCLCSASTPPTPLLSPPFEQRSPSERSAVLAPATAPAAILVACQLPPWI